MSVYVGLDCGGSSSRVLATDENGNVLFQGQAGAANLLSTPEPRLRKNLSFAIQGCPRADYVCGCFAGLINQEVREKGEEILRGLFVNAAVRAEPDYTAALYASAPETDLCVIAGTGSLVCSRKDGGVVKSGGRGYILGDFGSGFQFGRDALIHYLDGPQQASPSLRRAVTELFGTDEEGAIVAAVYRSSTPAGLLGKLAKVVGNDARNGEKYAIASVDKHMAQLVEVVRRHIHEYIPSADNLHVSLAGGVWKVAAIFRDQFGQMLGNAFPEREVTTYRIARPPLYGAVELAKELRIGH